MPRLLGQPLSAGTPILQVAVSLKIEQLIAHRAVYGKRYSTELEQPCAVVHLTVQGLERLWYHPPGAFSSPLTA